MQNNNNRSNSQLNVLYIADIVGEPGFDAVEMCINQLKKDHQIDFTIANGENQAYGKGLTERMADKLFAIGINVITSGNHIWNRPNFYSILDREVNILRPLNYPQECPGHGSCIVKLDPDLQIGVINLQGKAFMYPIECPFKTADQEIERLKSNQVNILIVDFHAEATAEKMALGWYLDGKISALIGSHTHVQTADAKVLPGGTAYITDAGMTGSFNSVIGMEKEVAIKRFITQLPIPYKLARGNSKCCGVVISIHKQNGKAISISPFQINT
jgi:metallophosphoesterase (TIGR00282 family)